MSLKISTVTKQTIDDLVTLFSEYQSFYGAKPDIKHNLNFLEQLLESNEGIFFIGKDGDNIVGYASLYFSYSSVSAKKIAILNDLYVRENFRKFGFGKDLIDYAIEYVKKLGLDQVRWCTRIDNIQAQNLYSKYPSNQTDWFHYDLNLNTNTLKVA
jgi:ribosomal protein S18 acetylase RimI-like enzyme